MRKLTEGNKMFISVMVVFAVYALIFVLFEDIDRLFLEPIEEITPWHILAFSLVVMGGLALLLHRYARHMDERISREQAEKENRMRRELTQNIAHELKTPVSSILGYVDTILENPNIDPETRHQFVVRTKAQAERLTSLLQDISTLNRMDYAQDQLVREPVDITQIVKDIVQETRLAASEKQMTVHNRLPNGITAVGNYSLLYSIFRNLVDNAINYAGRGADIEILAMEKDDCWYFVFQDNGPGIPAEHLSRIFERFYRIDKGRSRLLGGTGLGLSIVKNAVQLHGGTISVHNVDGGGLCFEFSISKE